MVPQHRSLRPRETTVDLCLAAVHQGRTLVALTRAATIGMAPQRDGRAGGAHLSAGTWGRVPSDEAKGPRQKALKGGHGERLWHRKQPQQAPSAQGEQVTSSPTGANFLHLGAHGSRCALAAADDHLGSVIEVRLRDLDGVEATFPRQVAVELVSGRSRAVGVLPLVAGDAELPVHVTAPMSGKSGLSLGQLALLRLLSAPEHASGRLRLRPASANQPPGRFWHPGQIGLGVDIARRVRARRLRPTLTKTPAPLTR